ncbi:MAG: chemotaxis response regulator protein-glutamate methylesterase [Acidobacteriota bacterium]|nr:chemotaxis response regulator protein-glutamate methylesterase [Acidobacteriota bacterium]
MPPNHSVRILIVDDSAVTRSLLRAVVASDAALEVVGVAGDGQTALARMESLKPDIVLLDVEMPVMDGLSTLKQLRARGHRMPVIMCSSLTQRGGRVTIEALSCGASDYVAKPSGQSGPAAALKVLSQELLPKIHALARTVMVPQSIAPPPTRQSAILPPVAVLATAPPPPVKGTPSIVVIGVSTGDPAALDEVLPAIPANFPLPIVIVQHMPEMFTQLLAEHLNNRCALHVCEAAEGVSLVHGSAYIARGNWHLEIAPDRHSRMPKAHLTQAAPENHCRPAADVLFRTAVHAFGAEVLAVVLTGMGSDGLEGSRLIRASGGNVIVQDRPTSAVWGMPGAVANAGLATSVLPLPEIAPEILKLCGYTKTTARQLRETVA